MEPTSYAGQFSVVHFLGCFSGGVPFCCVSPSRPLMWCLHATRQKLQLRQTFPPTNVRVFCLFPFRDTENGPITFRAVFQSVEKCLVSFFCRINSVEKSFNFLGPIVKEIRKVSAAVLDFEQLCASLFCLGWVGHALKMEVRLQRTPSQHFGPPNNPVSRFCENSYGFWSQRRPGLLYFCHWFNWTKRQKKALCEITNRDEMSFLLPLPAVPKDHQAGPQDLTHLHTSSNSSSRLG